MEDLAAFHKKSPDLLTQEEVDDYLLHLKDAGKSSSTPDVVVSGLRFFYEKALEENTIALKFPSRKKPRILPEVLSKREVMKIISTPVDVKHRVVLMLAYSAGLREAGRILIMGIDNLLENMYCNAVHKNRRGIWQYKQHILKLVPAWPL